jgi:osmotically-inducible protein OsmY
MKRSVFVIPAALAATLVLGACSPRDTDQAVAGVRSGMDDAKRAGSEAATTVSSAATDAMITTKVNAALAADDHLKAIRIDVDTKSGRVVLTGKAPDAASRDRATTLARAVDGVVAVENRLTIDGKS